MKRTMKFSVNGPTTTLPATPYVIRPDDGYGDDDGDGGDVAVTGDMRRRPRDNTL